MSPNSDMQFAKYNEAKQHLLYVYNILCPTGEHQRSHCDNEAVLSYITGVIDDGIAYDNWRLS